MKGDDVMKITPKDFVLGSSPTKPKTCTYKNRSLVSKGEGENRHMFIVEGYIEIGYFRVDTHIHYGYKIHSINGECKDALCDIFMRHCDRFDQYGFQFIDKSYESLNEIIKEVVDIVIKQGKG